MPTPLPVYPGSDLDRPAALLGTMGTFWEHVFNDQEMLASFLTGRLLVEQRTARLTQEVVDCASRRTVPALHTEEWFSWTIKASQLNQNQAAGGHFDDGLHAFDDGSLVFDRPAPGTTSFFAAPANLRGVAVITNRLTQPSRILFPAQDFTLVDGAVQFAVNPFLDPNFGAQPITDSLGEVVDQEITLWLFQAQFDQQQLTTQYGYVMSMQVPSTDNGRQFLNANFDTLVSGNTPRRLAEAFSALLDVPLVAGEETIQDAVIDNRGLLVITDRQTYRFPAAANFLRQIGYTVGPSTALTDALQISKAFPLPTVAQLTVPAGFMSLCYLGELTFSNKTVPLVVDTEHPSGHTYVSFEVDGFHGDVRQFFDELHARGLDELHRLAGPNQPAKFGTLAHYLDKRVYASTEPTADDLPATINPLEFLCRNCFRYNAYIIRIRKAACGPAGVGLQFAQQLQQLLPPQIALFVLIELTVPTTTISAAGWHSAPVTNLGLVAGPATIHSGQFVSDVSIRRFSRRCQ